MGEARVGDGEVTREGERGGERLVYGMIVRVLDSFEKLEVVVAIERAGVPQSTVELVRLTGIEEEVVREAAEGLVADGVVAMASGAYGLDRAGPWGPNLEALVALYRRDRMEVVTMMSRAALERMRDRASRAFADAFVIRRKKGPHDG